MFIERFGVTILTIGAKKSVDPMANAL